MDKRTRDRFARLWMSGESLADIADLLGYSFQSLAKWRMILNLPKRYGRDDGEIPTPAVIRLRSLEQQTNWSEAERRSRWRGIPHTIYQSVSTCDFQP